MIIETHQVIEEYIKNMNITRIVQTGFLNVPMTNMLSNYGEVIVVTQATFNPFEENEKVVIVNAPFTKFAYNFKKKYGLLDLCVFGHMEHLADFQATMCAWTPLLRKNGLMIFLNSEAEKIQKIFKYYINQVDNDYFEIINCSDITLIRVK